HVSVDQQQDFDEFAAQLLAMDEVVEIFNVTGEFDALVRIWVRDFRHLREFLYGKISELPAHQNTVSSMVLANQVKPLTLSGR
ncbi:MAG: Lrp/AsnC ligand binding domain-containing protein, partial [Anaerolineales bacterium]|nr:Lrp/AsnC ligand binding domain-containing protein [Anaerolineales bacterium]